MQEQKIALLLLGNLSRFLQVLALASSLRIHIPLPLYKIILP